MSIEHTFERFDKPIHTLLLMNSLIKSSGLKNGSDC